MKRLREESFNGSQLKRPFGTSRAESYGQPQNTVGGAVGGQKLTTDDALHYLKEVKEMFQDQREKYDHFLEVMKDFKAQRIDTEGVIARVKELFKGHNNLIYGFNTFLPKGFEITLDDMEPPPKKAVEFEEAISFVNKIKRRFQDDDHVYKSFLEILNMYRKEHKNICEVYDEVSQLFEEHPDLLEEFTRFLPDNSSSTTVHHSQSGRSNLQLYDDRSSAPAAVRAIHIDKCGRIRDRVGASHVVRDLTVDRPGLDEGTVPMKSQKDPRKRDKEHRDMDDTDLERESNRDFGVQRLDKRKLLRKVEGFGSTPAVASSDDNDTLRSMYSREFIFCEKVKEKLGPDDYQAFLKCLHIYTTEIITRDELQHLVADLLGKYPGLMDEFSGFVQQCENIDGFVAGIMNKKYDGSLLKQLKTEEKDKGLKRETDPAKEKPNKDYMCKSIQELDLSDCERCTPSYRHLPNDYPILSASQRSELGAEVLNDFWVSVTSGSEDFSFKHMRRNQYEESLFRCEDDRFELDMLLESVSSTAKRVEDALDSILNGPIRIEEYFTPLNLRCIERLYGDHGLDAMDILRKNAAVALPIILTRLKQKQGEWTKCRADFDKVWTKVYAKNHFKSLDHRSFYFKQQDVKFLSPKSLVAEIKEIKENMQEEDDILVAVAAGNKRSLIQHFKFEYSDRHIHEDLYKLIKFSCEEVCTTKEQLNKVMRLWTAFLEPMLGVTSRTLGVDKLRQQPIRDGFGPDMGGNPAVDAAPRQPKIPATCVDNSTADVSRCSRTINDCTLKELTLAESDAVGKDGSSFNAQPNILNDDGVADRGSPQNGVQSRLGKGHIESVSGPQATPKRNGAEDVQEPQSTSETVRAQSVAADCSAGTFTNGAVTQGSKANVLVEECFRHAKVEKEEGELSPSGDIEMENSMACGDEPTQAGSSAKYSSENKRHHNGEDVGMENDADDEDSENVSEAGDDVSGSESAEDDCSREEHEEEEDTEHDELEAKAESEGEAEVHCFGGDVGRLPSSELLLLSVKPLAKYVSSIPCDIGKKDSRVFYGNDGFYILFRLHRILYERLFTAKTNSVCSESKWRNLKESDHSDPYASFTTALYSVLDGSSDNVKYEDDCRAIIGNQSYVLFTLDKLIYRLVKQLQAVATDEIENKLLQLYEYERSRKPGNFVDSVYHENARVLLHEDNIYRLEFSSSPDSMSVQLMDSGNEKPEMVAVSIEPNFAAYLNNDFLSATSSRKEQHGIILQRNKRNYVGVDEYSATSKAMEGVQLFNGLECKMACSSSKISYVLDTEDFFYRTKSKRKSPLAVERLEKARVHRFNRFLLVACR